MGIWIWAKKPLKIKKDFCLILKWAFYEEDGLALKLLFISVSMECFQCSHYVVNGITEQSGI